jgi:hypothetical protein
LKEKYKLQENGQSKFTSAQYFKFDYNYGMDTSIKYNLEADWFASTKNPYQHMYLASSGFFKPDAATVIKFTQ